MRRWRFIFRHFGNVLPPIVSADNKGNLPQMIFKESFRTHCFLLRIQTGGSSMVRCKIIKQAHFIYCTGCILWIMTLLSMALYLLSPENIKDDPGIIQKCDRSFKSDAVTGNGKGPVLQCYGSFNSNAMDTWALYRRPMIIAQAIERMINSF